MPDDAGESIEQLGTKLKFWFAAKARSAFYEHSGAKRTMMTLDAFRAAARIRREAADYWLGRLSRLGFGDFEAIFEQVSLLRKAKNRAY